MQAYQFETMITKDGRIILPPFLKNIFNRRMQILLLDKKRDIDFKKKWIIPAYSCEGKLNDFERTDLYETNI